MDNKTLGLALMGAAIFMVVLLFFIRAGMVASFEVQAEESIAEIGTCHADGDECPHEQMQGGQLLIFLAVAVMFGVLSLGAYLYFFERSQKEIVASLNKRETVLKKDEKLKILLMGLDSYEKKIINAVIDQDGITQQTLRLRTDIHKSKLSLMLDSLEKKGLVKRVAKGKTKQVYLKIRL
ncbi:hypothetical protein HQ545_03710 [Candidatus Woesearchaeota archaeon]|nr:hypothetical protein [Candidatus Woesearchaeota archaeon]